MGCAVQDAKRAYLSVVDVLVNRLILAFALLGVEHVPEEAEPFVEETAIGYRRWDIRCGQIRWALLVNAVFGICLHAVATEIACKAAVTVSGSILYSDVWIRLEDCTRTVIKTISHEVFVDVGIEQCST